MIPTLIVAGIIFVAAIILETYTQIKIRKKFFYTIQNYKIEIITRNYSVKLFVDGEEKDKMQFGSFKWFNATLTTTINDNSFIVKITRKNLISSPIINITLNNEEIDLNTSMVNKFIPFDSNEGTTNL